MKRWPLITSFVLFIALCISVAYWAMQLFQPPVRAVVAPPQTNQPVPGTDAAAGLFGGHSKSVSTSNFQLKGVVVTSDPSESVAILSVNGKPSKAIRNNTEAAHGVTVKEVNRHYVMLSEGGVLKRVDLPEDAKTKLKAGSTIKTKTVDTRP